MIKGLDVFKNHFVEFQEQYVLIGGAACDIVFQETDQAFRATKDLDMVLIVEALTLEFGRKFWDFIKEGGYENRIKNNDVSQFYRFDKPKASGYPYMIELFAKSESVFDEEMYGCRPLHLSDEVSSLSAILLNSNYYNLLLEGKTILSDFSVLTNTYLILFKAKAWLDLTARKAGGQHIDGKDIKKHKNDIARLATLLTEDETCSVPVDIFADIIEFIREFEENPPDIKALGFSGITVKDITDVLRKTYVKRIG